MNKILVWFIILLSFLSGCNTSPSTPINPTPKHIQIQETESLPTAVPTKSTSLVDLSTLPVISVKNIDRVKKIDNFYGHTGFVGVEFSPDGKTLASFGYDDGTIRLWDLTTRSEFASFRHFPEVNAIAFNPDGSKIASGGTDKTIKLWDVKSSTEQAGYEGHTAGIGFKSLDWSPDGKLIAAGSRNDAIRIWEADTGTEYAVLHGHSDEITGISFSPDSALLASASFDNTIRLWDITTKSEQSILSSHSSDVGDVAFSPDGNLLASISGDITEKDISVRFWDVASGEQLVNMETHNHARLGSVSFSPDGLLLVTCGGPSSDGTINLYDVKNGDLVTVLDGGDEAVVGVSFSPDGHLIAISNAVGEIQLWGICRPPGEC